jgi:glycosyltransferase involved in cell wall biosynthesis
MMLGRHSVSIETGRLEAWRTSVEDKALIDLYNRASLLVYAPYLEPFGLTPLEAMACGTPVVAVLEGGARESVIHDQTGVLAERDDKPSRPRSPIADLLAADERRRRLGRQATDAVKDFWTWSHAGARLLQHLERVTNGAP